MVKIVNKEYSIGGMTCINSQTKIEKKLKSMAGIKKVQVSYKTGKLKIEYDSDMVNWTQIQSTVETLGYKIRKDIETEDNLSRAISLLVIIIALYVVLDHTGILNLLVPGQLSDSSMGYGMLFITGLITSVHCIAMCGGIHLSQILPETETKKNQVRNIHLYPTVLYNLGRVLAYTCTGFVLGFVGMLFGTGMNIGLSSLLQGIVKLVAGMIMVLMGANMLNLAPALRKFTIHMPYRITRKLKKRNRGNNPFLTGVLNGLMPCGPLQSIQLVALASGSPLAGAGSMLLFALGTVPLMLGFGTIVSVLGKKFGSAVMKIGAVLVTVLGFSLLSQGSSLSGVFGQRGLMILIVAFCLICVILNISIKSRRIQTAAIIITLVFSFGIGVSVEQLNSKLDIESKSALTDYAVVQDNGMQLVESTLQPGEYPTIQVKAGQPVRWIITAPKGSINGCNFKMFLNEYGIEHEFKTGENTIEFTPTKKGNVEYSCWMGMIQAVIHVS